VSVDAGWSCGFIGVRRRSDTCSTGDGEGFGERLWREPGLAAVEP
jgi:hypothetical protein